MKCPVTVTEAGVSRLPSFEELARAIADLLASVVILRRSAPPNVQRAMGLSASRASCAWGARAFCERNHALRMGVGRLAGYVAMIGRWFTLVGNSPFPPWTPIE